MKITQLVFLAWNYLTLSGILGSTLMVPMAYLDFELRREYIQEVLCINREKPDASCEGKCFLMKKLEQTQNLPAADRHSNENFQLSFFYSMENQFLSELNGLMEASQFNPCFLSGFTPHQINSIFHPPRN
jgi:hypothetical protein